MDSLQGKGMMTTYWLRGLASTTSNSNPDIGNLQPTMNCGKTICKQSPIQEVTGPGVEQLC